eukprot:TRINITY_DN11562_c1_g1_i1.p1 TRINITY_DN11562_c1_g1~~TRINITY_DN11562_c1_g1_i1.p1  ORF type:complete len:551 (+),score=263.63 TRINITY_DN11562_c1_g1_i1:60-1712(+)
MYADILENENRRQRENKNFALPKRGGKGGGKGHGGKGGERYSRNFPARRAQPAPVAPKELKEVLAKQALQRHLAPDAPQTPYRRRQGEVKTTLHWNDRKLLMYETEFLTQHVPAGAKGVVVVYLGAAPGAHLPMLSKLFPQVDFILVDKVPPMCKESKRIRVVQAVPNEELMRDLHQKFCSRAAAVLVISNTKASRGFDAENPDADPFSAEDLQKQLDYVAALPSVAAALLKLRLPYTSGTTEFAKGAVVLPVWGGQTSTETRLVPALPVEKTRYSHQAFEEQMFHFNTITRLETLPEFHPAHAAHERHAAAVPGCGYDYRYDATAEIDILMKYAKQHGAQYFADRVKEKEKERRKARRKEEVEELETGKKRKRADGEEKPLVDEEMARLLAKAVLGGDDLCVLVRRYSEAISKALEHGKYTLETHPLTHLHEPRTKENPFNQALKKEVLKDVEGEEEEAEEADAAMADAPAAEAGAVDEEEEMGLEFESEDEAPAPAPAPAPQSAKAKEAQAAGNVLSSLGVDLGDESDDSSSSSHSSEQNPAKRRKKV